MKGLTLFDSAFLAQNPNPSPFDDMEAYILADNLDGLNGGLDWGCPFIVSLGTEDVEDDFESYSVGDSLNSLNGGTNWAAAVIERTPPAAIDNFESYTVSSSLNGLTGGTGWDGAYIER